MEPYWSYFGAVWGPFWSYFGTILDHLGAIGGYWGPFRGYVVTGDRLGAMLGSLDHICTLFASFFVACFYNFLNVSPHLNIFSALGTGVLFKKDYRFFIRHPGSK